MKRYEKNEKEVLQSYFKMHEDYFKKNDDGLIPEGLNEMGWTTNAIWFFDKEISDIVNPFLDKMKKDLRMKDIPHISVTKIFEFDATHFLPYHNRRCKYLHGHCWNNIQSCISSLIEKCAGEVGVLAAFRLGKLCHYIVDAFTFPHNSDFSGTLSEHMAYEDDLTLYLIKNKQNMRFSPNRFSFSFRWIESLHEEYMAEKPSMSRDAYYALSASFAAAYALIGYEGDIVLA